MRHHLVRAGRAGRQILSSLTSRSAARRTAPKPGLEPLESRDLLSGFAHPNYLLAHAGGGAQPFASGGPSGISPARARHAYGFDTISFAGGTVAGDGTGTTIAIVDAYDDPSAAADLHKFDATFGLPDPVFTKVNQNGGGTLPSPDSGWALEIALDVEWAHAIAPKANILLVEASSNSDNDLFAAVRYAAKQPGVVAVSMSWGGGEFGGEGGNDGTFTTPAGHTGVTFLVSSGDSGAPDAYPSASPNVVSVGGTTLSIDSAGNYLGESGWAGSGGGISAYESQPAYQKGVVTQTSTKRANPDVAYDSNPSTGFPVCASYSEGTTTPWVQVGGTSDAAPQWAALIAIADQGRILAGVGPLDGPTQTLPALYKMSAADFHDVTSGTSTGTPNYSAGPGYDLVTGRGTPIANLVVRDLIGGSQARVMDGPAAVANGGSASFGALVGSTTTHTFTVQNLGAAPLTLADPIALPAGFTLVSDFGSTTLATGASTTFTVQINTSVAATYSGTVSFGTNDPNDNPYRLTLTGTVASTAIIDDSSPSGFGKTSGWNQFANPGYNGEVLAAAAGTGSSVATWTFAVAPGQYQVSATWYAFSNRATNSPYTVLDGSSALGTVRVNQQLVPADFTDAGFGWKALGTYTVTGNTLVVQLSNDANQYAIADAVRIQMVPGTPVAAVFDGSTAIANGGSDNFGTTAPGTPVTRTFTVKNAGGTSLTLSDPIALPAGFSLASDFGSTTLAPGASTTFQVQLTATSLGSYGGTLSFGTSDSANNPYAFTVSGTVTTIAIIDDSSPSGFSATAGWKQYANPGYNGEIKAAPAGTGSSVATWTFAVAPGQYQVSATWYAFSNRATNAPYTVLDGASALATVAVNQQLVPSDFTDAGFGWKSLGTFTVTGNTLVVQLSNSANQYVIADAIRVEYKGGRPSGPAAKVYDGGTAVANGGSDSFGSTFAGTPVTRTFTVKNTGTTALTLSDPIALPAGFSLASDFGSTMLAPGASTTFSVQLTAAAAGSYSGTLSFGTNDAANNPYTVAVSGTVSGVQIIDDSSPSGFSTTAGWKQFANPGYNDEIKAAPAGTGSLVATWTFNVPPGKYQVSATWYAFANRATNAPYTVLDGSSPLGTVAVNQQLVPSDFSDAGLGWKSLGTFTVTGSTLVVQLSNSANGYVIADAVRIQQVSGPAVVTGDSSQADLSREAALAILLAQNGSSNKGPRP